MKRTLLSVALILALFACTKENPSDSKREPTVPTSEFEALKQEVEKLKTQIETLTPGEAVEGITAEEFNLLKQNTTDEINALKEENQQLKAQISLFTSGFFEVEGLRFDKNGTLISVAKIANEVSQKVGEKTLTTTRTYDSEGRLIQIYRKYSGGSSISAGSPYYWQKVMYEYNGMNCKTTTQTSKYGLSAGTPYEEEITEATYW